jgi:2-amino-4-hydroxy-6-hydroxymethyldihydropteridine diphosphokinase
MPYSVLIALGSNLGNRRLMLARAIDELGHQLSIVRISPIHETDPVDAPPGSPAFLNMVIAGYTDRPPTQVLHLLQQIESRLARQRRLRNAPRTIDLDLILHSAHLLRTRDLTIPHPRYLERPFVMEPLRELRLPWHDPVTGARLSEGQG